MSFVLPGPNRRRLPSFLVAASLLVACGCGLGSSSGKVSGKILYRGQPVTSGDVNFYLKEKGVGAQAKIDASGTYAVPEPLEVGTYTVHVTPPPPEPGMRGPMVKGSVIIPRKYRDAATSGLSCTVNRGSNDYTIELTD